MNLDLRSPLHEVLEGAPGPTPDKGDASGTPVRDGDDALPAGIRPRLPREDQARVSPACAFTVRAAEEDSATFSFSPGEIISGRFRVRRFIACGGMGEVYEAQDLELGARVALKTVRHKFASDPQALSRFRSEVELARRVTHPNVCRIYDLEHQPAAAGSGEHDVIFLTMEFLAGETLAARLHRHRRMTQEEARPLIHQMADGLAAAHDAGVIHRDFKPSNVMLVEHTAVALDREFSDQETASLSKEEVFVPVAETPVRAVIMDFGLASVKAWRDWPWAWEGSLVAGKPLQTPQNPDGRLIGTFAYMAPEQREGRDVSPATDVYALGLVMYEMLTGRRPFADQTPLASEQGLRRQPPSPRIFAPGLEPSLESIILRCLENDPALRYPNARELAAALCDRKGKTPPRPLARWARTALVFLAAVFLAQPSKPVNPSASPLPIPDRKNLVVIPFTALDGLPQENAECDGITETVTAKLAQVASIQVPAAVVVRDRHVDSIERAATQFGANLVLSASWQQVGHLARINLSLIDTKTARQLRTATITAPADDVFSLQDQVVLMVLAMLQVQLSPGDQSNVTAHGTSDLTAYDLYVQGIGYLQNYHRPENVKSAITLLRRAVEKDEHYAQAHAALAEAYWHQYKATRVPQWAQEARAAVKAAEQLNSRLPEVQLAIGDQYMRTGSYSDAVSAFRRTLELDPENAEAYQRLGYACDSLGLTAQAEQSFRRAIQIRPACWSCYNSLGDFLNTHARYGEAAQAWQKVIELTPDNVWGYMNVGVAYLNLGDFERARHSFRDALTRSPDDPDLNSNAGTAAFYLGRYEEDARYCEKAIHLEPQKYVYRGNLADAYRMIPAEAAKAADTYRKAIALAERELQVNPHASDVLSDLALYYARVGDLPRAREYLTRALVISPGDVSTLHIACLVHLEAGERQEALKWLAKAVEAGYQKKELVADPELASLRSDPRFVQLVNEARTNP